MKLQPGTDGVEILFEVEEAGMLEQLVRQLVQLLSSHSATDLDPDPLLASLEIGGSEATPEDPALARLFPDAFQDPDDAAAFRRVTEQGLINRKLHDAQQVIDDLAQRPAATDLRPAVNITGESFIAWARTITALRLALAARIGLEQESDYDRLIDDEATRGTVLVYDWLAALLDAVIALGTAVESD